MINAIRSILRIAGFSITTIVFALCIALSSCGPVSTNNGDTNGDTNGDIGADPLLFAFSKAKLTDPIIQQQRGFDAVEMIGEAARSNTNLSTHLIQEYVRTLDDYFDYVMFFRRPGKLFE